MHIVTWIVLAVVVLGVLPLLLLSGVLYTVLLVRTSKKKWARECSIPDDEEYRRMFDIGIAWDKRWADRKTPVDIYSGRFHLFGEYFDFGGERAVIVVPGRMESLLYSYFFAEPYRAAGYNVLVIDNRAHGWSDGHVASLGFKEYVDLLAWARWLHEEKGVAGVVLHGICIGSSAGLMALNDPSCPDYLLAMVAEGMYTTFHESFRNHMIELHHSNFPLTPLVMLHVRVFSGADVVHDGPIRRIGQLKQPILFLHSREDEFSLPEKAEELYELCSSPRKQIVWFDRGKHSRIRINAPEKYDAAIVDFLSKL